MPLKQQFTRPSRSRERVGPTRIAMPLKQQFTRHWPLFLTKICRIAEKAPGIPIWQPVVPLRPAFAFQASNFLSPTGC